MAKNKIKEKEYLDQEETFFKWLEQSTDRLILNDLKSTIFALKIVGGYTYNRVNRGNMRLIVRFKNEELQQEYEEKLKDLEERFKETYPDRKRIPVYFPKFFNDAQTITLTKHAASATKNYTAEMVKSGNVYNEWAAFFYNEDNRDEVRQKVKGIKEKLDKLPYKFKLEEDKDLYKFSFYVNILQLMQCYDAKEISIKRDSGVQYHCRVKRKGILKTERHQFGLLVLAHDTDPEIHRSEQPVRRSDLLERQANLIPLPDPLDVKKVVFYKIFKKS